MGYSGLSLNDCSGVFILSSLKVSLAALPALHGLCQSSKEHSHFFRIAVLPRVYGEGKAISENRLRAAKVAETSLFRQRVGGSSRLGLQRGQICSGMLGQPVWHR